jgi:hypothetical protein
MRSRLFLLAAAIALLGSCAPSKISFNVPAPAPVQVPAEIKTIAIIDRSLPSDQELNQAEGILTIEGKDQDKIATQVVLDGLTRNLSGSDRFNIIRTKEAMIGSGSGFMLPGPLEWDIVSSLCEKYEADALISLETFDSDFIITNGAIPGKNLLEVYVRGVAKVDCGFRLYYPYSQYGPGIIDEFLYTHSMDWESGGMSVAAAVNTIMIRDNAIKDASFGAGVAYGQRITPSWYRVSRDYFTKSKKNPYLEEGARMMQLNDWDRSITALEKAVDNGDNKSRGRAAHNLAVVYEILGDLPVAMEWATVAWGRYQEKESREYGYILSQRIREQEYLEQ